MFEFLMNKFKLKLKIEKHYEIQNEKMINNLVKKYFVIKCQLEVLNLRLVKKQIMNYFFKN